MSLPKIFREELYRGDKWARTVTFTKSGHTWSNQSVSAVIKTAIDGTTVHTLSPSVSVVDTVVTAELSIPGATTAGFDTGELHMDPSNFCWTLKVIYRDNSNKIWNDLRSND